MKYVLGFIGVVAVLWGFWHVFVVIGWGENYSDGERSGEIFKFSKKGLIYKSWEGEMYLGGVSKVADGALVMDKFYFSIPANQETEKSAFVEQIQNCSRERKVCTIKYKEWFKSPIYQDSGYTVVGVESR